jgi:hypothetical protein
LISGLDVGEVPALEVPGIGKHLYVIIAMTAVPSEIRRFAMPEYLIAAEQRGEVGLFFGVPKYHSRIGHIDEYIAVSGRVKELGTIAHTSGTLLRT